MARGDEKEGIDHYSIEHCAIDPFTMIVIPAPYQVRDKLQQESRNTEPGCRIKCGMTCQLSKAFGRPIRR